jgi:hypothetical protein
VEVGIDNRRVSKVDLFQRFTVGDVEVLALPNRGSEDTKPCMRMSYLFTSGEVSVFHGGDSHGPSPAWSGHADGATLALLWPNHVDRALSFLKPESMALMHCDRFDPGDFLCGYDQGDIRERLRKRSRGTRILSPARGEWFWPERLSEEDLRRLREKPRSRSRRRRERREGTGGGPRVQPPPQQQQQQGQQPPSGPAAGDGGPAGAPGSAAPAGGGRSESAPPAPSPPAAPPAPPAPERPEGPGGEQPAG